MKLLEDEVPRLEAELAIGQVRRVGRQWESEKPRKVALT
jgi:nuclear transport factor 2 (NTF2) superfamily protein